jgi:hypothetical protein
MTGLVAAVSAGGAVSAATGAVAAPVLLSIAGIILSVPAGEVGDASGVVSDAGGAVDADSGLYILKLSCGSLVAAKAIGIDPMEIMALKNTGRTQRLINFSTFNSE